MVSRVSEIRLLSWQTIVRRGFRDHVSSSCFILYCTCRKSNIKIAEASFTNILKRSAHNVEKIQSNLTLKGTVSRDGG
jgi:hypothetical protein